MASLRLLVDVLIAYQEKPAAQWPQNVTINSIVAISIALLKSAMLVFVAEGVSQLKWAWFADSRPLQHLSLFDTASKGPKGTVSLLGTTRGHHQVLMLGCIVTILALAVDPFAQQLVHFTTCAIAQPGNSSISRSNWYNQPGRHENSDTGELGLSTQISMLVGVLNDGSVDTSFICPSGNCTFQNEYSTIGHCSACTDITHDIDSSFSNITLPPSLDGPAYCLTAI